MQTGRDRSGGSRKGETLVGLANGDGRRKDMSAGDVSIPEAVALDAGIAADANAGAGAGTDTRDGEDVEAQAGAGSRRGGAEFVIVDDDGGGDVDGLEG